MSQALRLSSIAYTQQTKLGCCPGPFETTQVWWSCLAALRSHSGPLLWGQCPHLLCVHTPP